MSKSKGNILDPLDLIDGIELEPLVQKRTEGLMQPQMATAIAKATREEFANGIPAFGADALRFTFAALATTGRDINFDLGRVEGYRNFCNKLWNAARFVVLNTEDHDLADPEAADAPTLPDRWILSRLQTVEAETARHITTYRFDLATQALYEFTWSEYCDWYVELAKTTLNSGSFTAQQRLGTRRTLVRVLEALLRLAHPIIPFITEEIWQRVAPLADRRGATIMLQPFPRADANEIDVAAEEEMGWVQGLVLGTRRIRGEMNIPPGKPLRVLLQGGGPEERTRLAANLEYIRDLARLGSVEWLPEGVRAPEAATALLGELRILIPLAGLIDKDAELARLGKELERLRRELQRAKGKLTNPNFVQRAPVAIVEKERSRMVTLNASIRSLSEQEARIARL